jgi:hypothetical protein
MNLDLINEQHSTFVSSLYAFEMQSRAVGGIVVEDIKVGYLKGDDF